MDAIKCIAAIWLLATGVASASTDPIPTNPETGAHVNRYAYANNHPYGFVDPDGRAARIVHHADGIRIELPAHFTGAGATQQNVDHIRRGFEAQSGVYVVGGQATRVDFRITQITGRTPRRLRNEVKLFLGNTDHPEGHPGSYAYVGGTQASIDVTGRDFPYGVGEHELNHLAGGRDAYRVDDAGNKIPDPARTGDVMNALPGKMTDTVIDEMLRERNNVHVRERT